MSGRKDSLVITDAQRRRCEELYANYRRMVLDPEGSLPAFEIGVPVDRSPGVGESLHDPRVMLQAHLATLRSHLELGDDHVPSIRVEFGTAQVPAAFGCKMYVPTNSLPCAGSHVIAKARDVFGMSRPALTAGWYGKVRDFTEIWKEQLPEGVVIQHPDIQSPFNNAHLIRGNDILTDFYDDPEAVDALLDLVTDFMIELVPWLKGMISQDKEWFFDWGALWKGTARISNCSMHMISPEHYRRFVLPRDTRLLASIGAGRVHYCGTSGQVIGDFLANPHVTGLDYDTTHHDMWTLSRRTPPHLPLAQMLGGADSATVRRLLGGDWPEKRNMIYLLSAPSLDAGRTLLKDLRESARRAYK